MRREAVLRGVLAPRSVLPYIPRHSRPDSVCQAQVTRTALTRITRPLSESPTKDPRKGSRIQVQQEMQQREIVSQPFNSQPFNSRSTAPPHHRTTAPPLSTAEGIPVPPGQPGPLATGWRLEPIWEPRSSQPSASSAVQPLPLRHNHAHNSCRLPLCAEMCSVICEPFSVEMVQYCFAYKVDHQKLSN